MSLGPDVEESYDALVVGAGPVGLTAALLLNKAGIRTALVERRCAPIGHPAGHVINPRSMEIWRGIDPALEAAIRNDSAAVEDIRYIIWCMSLGGPELGRIRTVPSSADELAMRLAYSPSRHAHYPQNRLEAKLWEQVAHASGVRFFHGNSVKQLDVCAEGVRAHIDGSGGARRLTARFCLAADGARSAIRHELGIAMPGPTIARIASVHFNAKLDRMVRGRPAVMYWIYNKNFLGPLIKHMDDEWILMTPLHPPQRPEHFDEAHWRTLIGHALGTQAVDVKINTIGNWAMTAQIADHFRSGPVFLVGDAAHRFPPTGGYGINTGVQDVHNLVWKLKAVLDGRAGDELLNSYEIERRPIAELNCKQSIDNQQEMDSINTLVSLPSKDMLKLHRIMESRPIRLFPESWRLKFVSRLIRLGLSRVAALYRPGAGGRKLRAAMRHAVSEQRAHFGAHGTELGYRYRGPLVMAAPYSASELSPSTVVYRASTVPGVMLPHAWLERDGQRVSSLDLLDYSAMQLIVDPSWRDDWAEALFEASQHFSYPVRLLTIGVADEADAVDPEGTWVRHRGVDASGAILARPDGHVAWRIRAMPVNPVRTLTQVLEHLNEAFVTEVDTDLTLELNS